MTVRGQDIPGIPQLARQPLRELQDLVQQLIPLAHPPDSAGILSVPADSLRGKSYSVIIQQAVEPAKNQPVARAGAHPSRSSAARSTGLSEHQRKTALRVASVPRDDFERQVEPARPSGRILLPQALPRITFPCGAST